MTDILTHIPDEDRCLAEADAALILERSLDLREFEGDPAGDDDYGRDDQ